MQLRQSLNMTLLAKLTSQDFRLIVYNAPHIRRLAGRGFSESRCCAISTCPPESFWPASHDFRRRCVCWLENSIFKTPRLSVDQSGRRGVKFLEQFTSAFRGSSRSKDPRNWSRATTTVMTLLLDAGVPQCPLSRSTRIAEVCRLLVLSVGLAWLRRLPLLGA
jgi:hypothetical protein